MVDPDSELPNPAAVAPLPGEPVPVVETGPGVFAIAGYEFATLEDVVWAVARRLPNRQVIVAYRVDFGAEHGTVTVATLNPDGTSHSDESHLMSCADADLVMLALAG